MPKVLNPPSGFLQNANDPPWNCTYPAVLDSKKYLPFVAPVVMGLRAQRAVNMIKDDSSISFDEFINYTLNTGAESAERFLDDLFEAVNKYPDTVAIKAMHILQNWDKKMDAFSRGAVLFSNWFSFWCPRQRASHVKRLIKIFQQSSPHSNRSLKVDDIHLKYFDEANTISSG